MSKLSLSRSRAKANGPMTSTQDPRAREVPTGRLSRDELIFQRQIEAAMLLEQAARIPETAAGALLAHGRLLVAAADYEKALEHLEKSQELSPNESLADYIAAIRELVETR